MNESQAPQALSESPQTSKRTLLWAMGLAGLAATGLGWKAWHLTTPPSLSEQASLALWQAEFETPDGQTLALRQWQGQRLLINFWATWCPPCIKEMPLLVDFYRQQAAKGFQVLGLAIDQPSAVRRFLQELPIPYAVGMAGLNGTQLMKLLGNDQGSLPFTLVLDKNEAILFKKLGQIHEQELARLANT